MLSVSNVNSYNPYFKANVDNKAKDVPMGASRNHAKKQRDERTEYEKKVRNAKIKSAVVTFASVAASLAIVGAVLASTGVFKGKGERQLKSLIDSMKNAKYKEQALNEYSQPSFARSTRRISDLITLDSLSNEEIPKITKEEAREIIKTIEKRFNDEVIGMDEVKEPILREVKAYLNGITQGRLPDKPLVICLDGPPGVGKTFVTEIIADALGMPYKKISLAGATGKAPIKGSEQVYQGADIGEIARGQIEGKSRRICYVFDEAEKSGSSDYNGNTQHTLLSLLDGSKDFVDDNLRVPIDTSQSFFILTTNEYNLLSEPLRSRVPRIEVKPYTKPQRAEIAKSKLKKALDKKPDIKGAVDIDDKIYIQIANLTTDQGARQTVRQVEDLLKDIEGLMLYKDDTSKIKIDEDFIKNHLKVLKDEV